MTTEQNGPSETGAERGLGEEREGGAVREEEPGEHGVGEERRGGEGAPGQSENPPGEREPDTEDKPAD